MVEQTIDPRITSFVQKLGGLDAGDRARLKRNASRTLAEARGVNLLIYSLLPPGLTRSQEEVYFLVATLYPLAEDHGSGNLGSALRKAQTTANRKGIDRRIEALLDADTAQLPFRLRQAVHFLQSNRVKVDWTCLLDDLLRWNHPGRFIQQSWARCYFSTREPEPTENQNQTD